MVSLWLIDYDLNKVHVIVDIYLMLKRLLIDYHLNQKSIVFGFDVKNVK